MTPSAHNKPENFTGVDFKTWQSKMYFYLTTLGLQRFVEEDEPKPAAGQTAESHKEFFNAVEAWKHSDFLARNYILNCLDEVLYKVYQPLKTAKSLWEALAKKYKIENATLKKFIVDKFMEYKMVDSKSVTAQVQELQIIIHQIEAEGHVVGESFFVEAITGKLPPSWKDFRHYLKHKKKDISLEDLIVRLKIEADNRGTNKITGEKANALVMENSKFKKEYSNNKKKTSNKRKASDKGFKDKKPYKKINGNCWVCGKPGHAARDCKFKKEGGTSEANMAEKITSSIEDMNLSAVVSQCNLIQNSGQWWIDTGATVHVCSERSMFSTYQKVENEVLYMGNSAQSPIVGRGQVILKWTSGKTTTLNDVIHVPEIRKNLISGTVLSKKGFRMVIESDKVVLTKAGVYVGRGYLCDGLFKANVAVIGKNPMYSDSIINKSSVAYLLESEILLWHDRLGHINFRKMKKLANLGLIPKFEVNQNHKCETCVEAKMAKKPFHTVNRSTEPLGLIHTDLCDFKSYPTRNGKKYFITFIDDCTRYCYVYLLTSKDEAITAFTIYKAEVENQLSKKIKMLRSDRGGEYESPFAQLCAEHGIIHQTTAPYSPQQNGIAERKNRTLKDMINSMLLTSGLPTNLWGEALNMANYILNRVPHSKNNSIPYELWKGHLPTYQYLKVWGCLAKVPVSPPKKPKLGPKTVDCYYLGRAQNSAAYKFLVFKSDVTDISINTILESRDATFFEDVFPHKRNDGNTILKRTREVSTECNENNDELPRRSVRTKTSTSFGSDFITYVLESEPQTYKEAMSSSDSSSWKEAVNSEIESILINRTWELVDLPPGIKPIGCKWIFKKKMKPDGTIDKYKARLVAKGYRQKEGIDFFDTYSPVTRITSIRMLIAIAAIYNLEIHQMDVKTAFLNGDLEEEIYMEQPEGFLSKGNETKVCRLVKSLYGLKQAPKQWHEKFDSVMLNNGFRINECDKCVYYKQVGQSYVMICLYVDDMLIFGPNFDTIKTVKKMLINHFDMKDLGVADVILGIKIIRTPKGIQLSQSHYVKKVIERFKNYGIKEATNPFSPSVHLHKNTGESVMQLEYSRVIGCLMYIMNCTRPDIAYAVNRLSRYTSNPANEHWAALLRVLGYLKKTTNFSLNYERYPAVLEGYTDANWISDSKESKSTSGYVFTLAGGAVSWKSSKQTLITRSTMESEFVALDKAGEEAEWLRQFLEDIPFWPKPVTTICIHCDNQAALSRAKSSVYNGKSRHIRRRHNTIRKLLSKGIISIDYVRSKDNLADPFTKGLSREIIEVASRGMGLRSLNSNELSYAET